MKKNWHHCFITSQISEIKKYMRLRKKENCELDENLLALEWIERNAKQFWENWKNK